MKPPIVSSAWICASGAVIGGLLKLAASEDLSRRGCLVLRRPLQGSSLERLRCKRVVVSPAKSERSGRGWIVLAMKAAGLLPPGVGVRAQVWQVREPLLEPQQQVVVACLPERPCRGCSRCRARPDGAFPVV